MQAVQVVESSGPNNSPLCDVAGVDPIEWDDSSYYLLTFQCPRCSASHYRVSRHSGVFYSLYVPPDDFEPAGSEDFCREIHENMQFDRSYVLDELRALISEHNCSSGIQTDGSYLDQLMDFSRLRLRALNDTGDLARLERGIPKSSRDRAVTLAFELGYAASELRMRPYEAAIVEGWRLQEGREVGREAAALAKQRSTRKTREAIKAAALELYSSHPALSRNDAATAREIEGMHLDALCRNGRAIGSAAIVKHLRALHQTQDL